METVATAHLLPIFIHRPGSRPAERRSSPASVVLQAAIDPVGATGVDRDVIKLADRHVIDVIPVTGAIIRHVKPAIAAEHQVAAVPRVDPEGVVIGVNSPAAVPSKCLSAVG